MTAYVIRRMWQMIPTLAGVILLIFFLFNWVGGDPAQVLAGKISNPEQIANIRRQLGVDQPYWYQLWVFVQQVFTFDFGRSWSTNEEVSRILLTRVGPTLTIMVLMVGVTGRVVGRFGFKLPLVGGLLLLSALTGAVFLPAADLLQILVFENQLAPGVVLSLIGGPFFVGLLWRKRRELALW